MSTQETLIILAITSPLWAPFVGLVGVALIMSMVKLVRAFSFKERTPSRKKRKKK